VGENYEMTQDEIAAALNEWMRRFIEEPARFEREFQTITTYQADVSDGVTPTYGQTGAAYLLEIHQALTV
jgi:hypothetical protein